MPGHGADHDRIALAAHAVEPRDPPEVHDVRWAREPLLQGREEGLPAGQHPSILRGRERRGRRFERAGAVVVELVHVLAPLRPGWEDPGP